MTTTLDSTKLVIPGRGFVCFAPADTAPIDPYAFDFNVPSTYAGWSLSHTSIDNLPTQSKNGGDLTAVDTWEQESVRSSQAATTIDLTVNKVQIDNENLSIAFPGGTYDDATGAYDVKTLGTTQRAVQIIAVDPSGVRAATYYGRTTCTVGDLPGWDASKFRELQIRMQVNSDKTGRLFREYVPRAAKVIPTTPPVITNITPSGAAPGATVTLAGSAFTGTTAVKFGSTNGTNLQVISDTSVSVVIPSGVTGQTQVTAVSPLGTSAAYTYTAA